MRRLFTVLILGTGLAACTPDGSLLYTPKSMKPVPPQTLALMAENNMDKNAPILMRVFKADARLEIWKRQRTGKYVPLKSYDICRWSGDLGPKKTEGDRQAPEGFYTITPGMMNPNSSYHLAFDTGFPNAYDRAHGRSGSNLMVHGDCSSRGCYAMTDDAVEEIYAIARDAFDGGQKGFQLQLMPFRMTAENIYKYRKNSNIEFWKNLKEGSDHFEVTRDEPLVAVCAHRYVFNEVPFDANAKFEPTGVCPPAAVPAAIQNAVAARTQQEVAIIAQLSNKDEKDKPSVLGSLLGAGGKPEDAYDSHDKIVAELPKSSPEALSLLPGVEAGPSRELRRIAQLNDLPPAPPKLEAGEPVAPYRSYANGESAAAAPQKPAESAALKKIASATRKPAGNVTLSLRGAQD